MDNNKRNILQHLIIGLYLTYPDKFVLDEKFFICYTNSRRTYQDINSIKSKVLLKSQSKHGYTDTLRAYKRDYSNG